MEKQPCTTFYGVLIRFLDVIKLQSFEFSVNDIIPANVQNISPLLLLHFFFCLTEEKHPLKFYGVFDNFSRSYEVAKF